MFSLKNKGDLSRVLRKPVLFSKDPVFFLFSRQPRPEPTGQQTRINVLKKENSRLLGIRIMLISLALLSLIYIHMLYLPARHLVPAIGLILAISICMGLTGMVVHRFWIKNCAKRK